LDSDYSLNKFIGDEARLSSSFAVAFPRVLFGKGNVQGI
jgi:hypothetical protein